MRAGSTLSQQAAAAGGLMRSVTDVHVEEDDDDEFTKPGQQQQQQETQPTEQSSSDPRAVLRASMENLQKQLEQRASAGASLEDNRTLREKLERLQALQVCARAN